jgi:HTH-type transcriptional regulator / antitoxin HigA
MVEKKTQPILPDYAVPPGETLRETLEGLNMTQTELAERTGRPKKTINEILQGKAAITADTALQFERVLGVPASFWNNLERNYRETLARLREEEKLHSQTDWLKQFPVASMIKLGWIKKETTPDMQLREMLSFFGVADAAAWQRLWESPNAVYRRSPAWESSEYALASWLRKGEVEAAKIPCTPYDARTFRSALEGIRILTTETPETFQPKMKELCASAGIALTFVAELPKTRVYGATRWLGPSKALIQLSLRGKSDDHFWFTFFHEAGHILLHGKRAAFVDIAVEKDDPMPAENHQEEEANAFAKDFLIPPSSYRAFRAEGKFDEAELRRFADAIGIAPGIVAGRLQHEGVIPFSQGSGLKQRFTIS